MNDVNDVSDIKDASDISNKNEVIGSNNEIMGSEASGSAPGDDQSLPNPAQVHQASQFRQVHQAPQAQPLNQGTQHYLDPSLGSGRRKGSDWPPLNIVLIGPMASGKTTVGWLLARLIGYGFVDLDMMIEAREGLPIQKIFESHGEQYFRDKEHEALSALRGIRSHVIAMGGGSVVRDENWNIMTQLGPSLWINPPPEEVARRLLSSPDELAKRPLLSDILNHTDAATKQKILAERIMAISGQRQSHYKKATFTISNTFSTPHTTALMIKELLLNERVLPKSSSQRFFDRWNIL